MVTLSEFTPEVQRQRFDKGKSYSELSILREAGTEFESTETPFGLLISTRVGEVAVEVYLDGKYPLHAPRVQVECGDEFPSKSDGREVLGKDWTPRTTVQELLQSLELSSSASETPKYHLGRAYYLRTWSKPRMKVFECTELDPNISSHSRARLLAVTHFSILLLEPHAKFPGIGHLVCWGSIGALTLKQDQDDLSRLQVLWPQFCLFLRVGAAAEFLELLTTNFKELGGNVKSQAKKKLASIDERDVNAKSLNKVDISKITKKIGKEEKKLDKNLTYAMIDSLIKLYQQAVEYYSALNDPKFDLYLNKMQEIMRNERVLNIYLGGPPEAPKFRDNYEDQLLAGDTTVENNH